jgi:hypothetical protein
LSYLILLFEDT